MIFNEFTPIFFVVSLSLFYSDVSVARTKLTAPLSDNQEYAVYICLPILDSPAYVARSISAAEAESVSVDVR